MGLMEAMGAGRRTMLLAPAVALAVLAVPLAGCGSSGSSSSPGSATSSRPAAMGAGSTASAAAASFVSIVEPFDPGHPAGTESAPASCGSQPTTLAIERCYQTKTENVDSQIDVAQFARYSGASATERQTILAQDSAWLAARGAGVPRGLQHRRDRRRDQRRGLPARREQRPARRGQGNTPPEARLKGTDSTDPNQLSWYTTPEGSRIAEIDTQGDQTGGAVVAWVIVGGAQGFVVNPRQFYFQDGSFTDPGLPEPSTPAYYRVPAGKEFQFSVDYSKLAKDPNADKSGAGYLYAPGRPAAARG